MKTASRSLFVIILWCFAAFTAHAVNVTREATGFGKTYQEAAAMALLEAVRQVRGAEVSSQPGLYMEFERLFGDGMASGSGSVGQRDSVSAQSMGWVSSYRVVSVREPSGKDGQWRVTVSAQIPAPKVMEPNDTRPTLVISPLRFNRLTVGVDDSGQVTMPPEVASRLQSGVRNHLVQSGRFAVIDRGDAEVAAESTLVRGADLVLSGTIQQLSNSGTQMYGLRESDVRLEFSWELVETATQKILWSDRVVREISPEYDERVSDLLDRLSGEVASAVLDTRYPVLVLAVKGGEILLNQGESRLRVGQKLSVSSAGETIKDPQTGRPVTLEGKTIATIEVVRVAADHAAAKLTEGSLGGVRAGQAVRTISLGRAYPTKEARPTAGSGEAPLKW